MKVSISQVKSVKTSDNDHSKYKKTLKGTTYVSKIFVFHVTYHNNNEISVTYHSIKEQTGKLKRYHNISVGFFD